VQNGYTRLYQLAEEDKRETGASDLVGLCPGMSIGVAQLLLKYATKDCKKIRNAIAQNER
jgi:hypothetical protein